MKKNKIIILLISFLLIISFALMENFVSGSEYIIEEGGGCSIDGDCSPQDCKIASCVEGSCVYSNEPDNTFCDDGFYCTIGDTCSSGTCQPGVQRDCSSLDSDCSQGVCNESTDSCESQSINESQSCDDGLICTENEICQTGTCSGISVDTDDGVSCTVDSCNENDGIVHIPDNDLCDSGYFCDVSQGCFPLACNNDGIKGDNEACDGTDFGAYDGTCHNYDSQYSSGSLLCSECEIDVSSCVFGICGDSVINSSEGCDDSNAGDGDGCNSQCAIESNWTCSGEPSVCEEEPSSSISSSSGGPSDITPPSIFDIEATVTSNSATITWRTDESSITWVEYGLNSNYGQEIKTTNYITFHSATLSNLLLETSYHYKIRSRDRYANAASFTDKVFTTLVEGQSSGGDDLDLIAQLQARIAEILAEIARLQALIAQLQGGVAIIEIPEGFRFNNNLKLKDVSQEVKYLQIFLNSDIDTKLNIQSGNWGSSGKESIYFGPATYNAAVRFQEKYRSEILTPLGLPAGTGFVGFSTRGKINQLLER